MALRTPLSAARNPSRSRRSSSVMQLLYVARRSATAKLCPVDGLANDSSLLAKSGGSSSLSADSHLALIFQSADAWMITDFGTPRVFQFVADWSDPPKRLAIEVKSFSPLARPAASKRCAVLCMAITLKLLHVLLLHAMKRVTLHPMCNARAAIEALGGPSAVAKAYGLKVQRVCNWGVRGVPASVLLDYPDLADALRSAGYVRPAMSGRALNDAPEFAEAA